MDEQRKLLIKVPDDFRIRSSLMLQNEMRAGLDGIHRRLNKVQTKLNNDAADAMAFVMNMMFQPGCVVIKEEHDS